MNGRICFGKVFENNHYYNKNWIKYVPYKDVNISCLADINEGKVFNEYISIIK